MNWFNNMKIRVKFLMIVLILVSSLLITEIVSREIVYKAYDEQIYAKTVQILSTYSDRIEIEFSKMETITFSMVGDTVMQNHLMTIRDEKVGSEDWVEARSTINYLLDTYQLGNPFFKNLWIFTEFVDIGKIKGTEMFSKAERANYITKAKQAEGSMLIILDDAGVTLVRDIRQIKYMNLTSLGVMAAVVDFKALAESCLSSFKKNDMDLDVDIYKGDILIYSSHPEKAKYAFQKKGWRIENNDFVVSYSSAKYGMDFVASVSYTDIYKSITVANRISFFIVLVVALIAIFFTILLVNIIVKGLSVLVSRMDEFKSGLKPDERLQSPYNARRDEIGKLHRHFSHMIEEYQELMAKHYESILLLKESQYMQLQQQIQPHFLFNTLSSISWMAYENGDEELAHITVALSRILRTTLNQKKKVVTVKEELEVIRDYLFIQKSRYGDKLIFEINLQDEILNEQLPPMTLQPVVENAITHGLEEMLETCIIKISGRFYDDYAEIVIANNGPPIDMDVLKKVESGAIKAKGMGIGLNNINNRIILAFSPEYGLSFRNENGFTHVIIRIPHGTVME